MEMQNLLRQQPGPRSINFVELVVRLFCALAKTLRPSYVALLLKTLETIVELVQVDILLSFRSAECGARVRARATSWR